MSSTTETPIRLRLRMRNGSQAYNHGVEIVLAYLEAIARQYQVTIASNSVDGIVSYYAHSVGLTLTASSSAYGCYFTVSEYLNIAGLEGRKNQHCLIKADGLIELAVEIVRTSGDSLPTIAVPDLIATFARDDRIGLVDLGDNSYLSSSPLSIAGDVNELFDTIVGNRRLRCLIIFGRHAPTLPAATTALSRRTCGLASVVTIDSKSAFEKLNALLGGDLEVPATGMRIFAPILDRSADPLRSTRTFLPEVDDGEDIATVAIFTQALIKDAIWSAARFSALAVSLVPMPSWEHARQIIDPLAGTVRHSVVIGDGNVSSAEVAAVDSEASTLRARVNELQQNIDALRETITVLTEEKAFEEQVVLSWKHTAELQKLDIERLSAGSAISEAMTGMSQNWRRFVEELSLEAVVATEQSQVISDLRESLAIVSAQYRNLEQRAGSGKLEYAISPPRANDSASLAIYLAEKYPGRFALLGQGARSYKASSAYADPERFLLALEILGDAYFSWKTASQNDMTSAKERFEHCCREASFKTSPSATPQGLAAFPDDHTIRLITGNRVPMYELRDHGTTMEGRHMLYIGFVWDESCGQVILGRFDHPPTLSMHT